MIKTILVLLLVAGIVLAAHAGPNFARGQEVRADAVK